VWTVIFNVIHGPQNPVIIPLTYQVIDSAGLPSGQFAGTLVDGPWAPTVPVMGVENKDVIVTWNATSVDVDTFVVPWSSLQATMVNCPAATYGSFHAATANPDDSFTVGDAFGAGAVVPRDTASDGLWRVAFRPVAGTPSSGVFTIRVDDVVQSASYHANINSPLVLATIKILATPRAPTILWGIPGGVNNHTVTSTESNTIITNATLVALDAGAVPLLMSVYIERIDGKALAGESISLYSANNPLQFNKTCVRKPAMINCTDSKYTLSQYLSQVSFNNLQTGVKYNIVAFVNSLGAGADVTQTKLYYETAQDEAELDILAALGTASTTAASDSNSMAGIIGGAAGAGGLAAVGVYRLVKKKNPPITGFFGEENMATDAVMENPLYEGDGDRSFTNPLYEQEAV